MLKSCKYCGKMHEHNVTCPHKPKKKEKIVTPDDNITLFRWSKQWRHKRDEFYTQLSDITRELQYYKEHFKDKVVYCNCDDPRVSNFFRYFVENFHVLGLKKLIASCYRESEMDLFHTEDFESGFYCEYTGDEEIKNAEKQVEIHHQQSIHYREAYLLDLHFS